jgi:hypothetical protein
VREFHDHRQFRAAVVGRPAHGRLRHALGRWLRLRPRSTY